MNKKLMLLLVVMLVLGFGGLVLVALAYWWWVSQKKREESPVSDPDIEGSVSGLKAIGMTDYLEESTNLGYDVSASDWRDASELAQGALNFPGGSVFMIALEKAAAVSAAKIGASVGQALGALRQ